MTGVQTCALPISGNMEEKSKRSRLNKERMTENGWAGVPMESLFVRKLRLDAWGL